MRKRKLYSENRRNIQIKFLATTRYFSSYSGHNSTQPLAECVILYVQSRLTYANRTNENQIIKEIKGIFWNAPVVSQLRTFQDVTFVLMCLDILMWAQHVTWDCVNIKGISGCQNEFCVSSECKTCLKVYKMCCTLIRNTAKVCVPIFFPKVKVI